MIVLAFNRSLSSSEREQIERVFSGKQVTVLENCTVVASGDNLPISGFIT